MKVVDLFEGWTPQMVEILKDHRGRNSGEGTKLYWSSLPPEEKQKLVDRFQRDHKAWHKGMSEEDRTVYYEKLKVHMKGVWIGRIGFTLETYRKAVSQGVKAYWANLTSEELSQVWRNRRPPTVPELIVKSYLDKNHPGEWVYNGDGKEGFIIGGKIPDFVNVDGKKEVIEVFGVYYHPLEDEEIKINHYRRFGYKCIVIWEWDTYDAEELDKLLKENLANIRETGLVLGCEEPDTYD